jgi:hypothetical protein
MDDGRSEHMWLSPRKEVPWDCPLHFSLKNFLVIPFTGLLLMIIFASRKRFGLAEGSEGTVQLADREEPRTPVRLLSAAPI